MDLNFIPAQPGWLALRDAAVELLEFRSVRSHGALPQWFASTLEADPVPFEQLKSTWFGTIYLAFGLLAMEDMSFPWLQTPEDGRSAVTLRNMNSTAPARYPQIHRTRSASQTLWEQHAAESFGWFPWFGKDRLGKYEQTQTIDHLFPWSASFLDMRYFQNIFRLMELDSWHPLMLAENGAGTVNAPEGTFAPACRGFRSAGFEVEIEYTGYSWDADGILSSVETEQVPYNWDMEYGAAAWEGGKEGCVVKFTLKPQFPGPYRYFAVMQPDWCTDYSDFGLGIRPGECCVFCESPGDVSGDQTIELDLCSGLPDFTFSGGRRVFRTGRIIAFILPEKTDFFRKYGLVRP